MKKYHTVKSALEMFRAMQDQAFKEHDRQLDLNNKRRAQMFFDDACLYEKIEEVLSWVLEKEYSGKAHFASILGQSCDEVDASGPEPSNN